MYRRASLVETFKESILNPLYCTFIAKNYESPSITLDVRKTDKPDATTPIKASKAVDKRTKRKKKKKDKV